MTIEQTTLPFLREDCARVFGTERGGALFRAAEAQYQALLEQTGGEQNPTLQEHFQQKLLPPMAYYRALRDAGFAEAEALAHVRQETQKAARIRGEGMRKMARLPFAYTIFRMGTRSFMKKAFPEEGWKTEWVRCDGQEIHFNLHTCPYWELTRRFGCPELCTVYCENDDIAFSGLLPKVRFARTGTLGTGASCCDFHFYPNKK